MNRHRVNRTSGVAPVGMSLLAFLLAMFVVVTGWERNYPDEGDAAHIFQLLIVLQAPLILLFLATADWQRRVRVYGLLATQILAIGIALSAVYFAKL